MGDCAINIKPSEDELVEIALETAATAKVFGIDPKVAFLSYSTLGSGKGEDVDKMRHAFEKAHAAYPDLAMGDCAINIKPTEDELVEIAYETSETARTFGIDPKIAFLSYSTLGSGKGEDVDKMRNACAKAKAAMPDLAIDGELQFDAAVSPTVARTKCPNSNVAGHANTFIFPDINAGNIGYKICQRMGSFDAYGPILQGLNAPINDLSRGCNAQEVYSMAIITAGLCND